MSDTFEAIQWIAIILVAAAIFVSIAAGILSVVVVEDRVITVEEKLGAHGDDGRYQIIDTDSNVYTVEDNYLLLSFDASNRYAKLKEGCTFAVQTRGIRFPLLSWYPNIMSSTQSVSLEHVCPLAVAESVAKARVANVT
jgi:hypothetical protein